MIIGGGELVSWMINKFGLVSVIMVVVAKLMEVIRVVLAVTNW